MPTTFSQFLLQNEYASLAELEEASQATVLYGGRLGSALIELGILTPEQVDAALARFHGLPEIPREWLARPDAAARAALHLDLIKRLRSFPLNFEKRSLHVGMVDPRNEEVIDQLAFASGCLVVAYALTEFRFAQLMQRIYGVAPSSRFKTLLDEGARTRAQRNREEQRKLERAERERSTDSLEIGPLAADLELTDDDAFFVAGTIAAPASKPLPAPAPTPALAPVPAAPAPPAIAPALPGPTPVAGFAATQPLAPDPAIEIDDLPIVLDRRTPAPTLESFERTIAESGDRARVIDASLALAMRFAAVAALFVIRDGVAAGLAGVRGEEPLDLDAVVIPLASENLLAACVSGRAPTRAVPATPLDKLLARALRASEHTELAVFPVAIGERVVNLLVAQPEDGALGATSAAALAAIAPQLAAAYERLIRAQKQQARSAASPPGASADAPAPAGAATKAAIGALPLQKRIVRVPAKS